MKYVNGTITMHVAIPVNEESDDMAKLVANYMTSPELVISCDDLGVTDCKGEKHRLIVNEILDATLDDVVD